VQELLELLGRLPQAARFRRRPPLAEQVIPVVEEEPVDDDGDVRAETTAPFELAEDRVVVLDQLQHHERAEILPVGTAQPPPPADEGDRPLDLRQVAQQ
jgi:hypothetical protein